MKKIGIYFILLLLICFIFSCDDDNSTEPDDGNNGLVTFYGSPSILPQEIIAGNPTDVKVTVTITPHPTLTLDSVKLQKGSSGTWSDLATLADNGDLTNGDEILGDNVYSAIYQFNEANTGDISLRIVAITDDDGTMISEYSPIFELGIYQQLTEVDYNEVETLQTEVSSTFEANLAGSDIETAIANTHNWVSQQAGVVNSQIVENGIDIVYDSGVMGGMRIYQEDASGQITTKGWNKSRDQVSSIPLSKQSRGVYENYGIRDDEDEDIIGNTNMLIWAPFENAFGIDMRPSLETIIDNSEMDYMLISLTNSQCTISSLNNLTDYGIVIFDTHGSGGMELGTGEEVTLDSYLANIINLITNRVSIWENVTVSYSGAVANKKSVFAIRAPFIEALAGTFPNSLIFNGSCESTKTMSLKNAFINKGAQTYFGFDKVVNTQFCKDVCDDIIQDVLVDLETTGEGFSAGQTDPVSPNATYEMYGNEDLHYSLSLINGDFEMGNLTGWSTAGDGRVITQLGTESPTEGSFMGIISTGLGFTEATGSIFQSFRVLENHTDLSFKWNFLSEEFMEYVGSIYQDYFQISIIDSEGYEEILFYRSIDDIAEQYSPYLVSPEIVFDVGDVYGIGWRDLSFDLSAYENEIVTLKFAAGDVGDSVLDTVILLDDIKVD